MSEINCPHCGESHEGGSHHRRGFSHSAVAAIVLATMAFTSLIVIVLMLALQSAGGGAGMALRTTSTSPRTIGKNESATIGSLRSLVTAQEQFKQQCVVDQDADGMGEYGWLGELAGTNPVRVSSLRMSTSPFIAAILGVKDANGFSQKSGYYYRLFLPGKSTAMAEAGFIGNIPAPSISAAADAQEVRWCAYAWPATRGVSGNRAFFVNSAGEVYATPNTAPNQLYSGVAKTPPSTAAYDTGSTNAANLDGGIGLAAAGLTAGDGGVWVPCGG